MATKTVKTRKAKPLATAYEGATPSILRQTQAFKFVFPQDEDSQTSPHERTALTLEAEGLWKNHPITSAAVSRIIQYSINAEGLMPSARSSDEKWNELAERYFKKAVKGIDIRGRSTWRHIQELVLTSKMITGDCLFIKYKGNKLQPIESARILSPLKIPKGKIIVNGIETNALGQIVAIWVGNRNQYGQVDPNTAKAIPYQDCIYVTNSIRFDQYRGIPLLAPILPILADINELHKYVLAKAKLEASVGLVITTATPVKQADNMPLDDATDTATGTGEGIEPKKYEYFNQLNNYYLRSNAGESVDIKTAQYPSSTFEPFARLLITEVAGALGIPDSLILADFSKTRVASSKAALIQFYNTIDCHQQWLIDGFCQPTWNWIIGNAILGGELPAPPADDFGSKDYTNVQWNRPDRPVADPKSEIAAAENAYKIGLTSLTAEARTQGKEIEDIMVEKKKEMVMAATKANEANEEIGKDIFTWKDFISVGNVNLVTDGSSQVVNPDGQDAQDAQDAIDNQDNQGN